MDGPMPATSPPMDCIMPMSPMSVPMMPKAGAILAMVR